VKPEEAATIAARLLGRLLGVYLLGAVLRSGADLAMRASGLRTSSRSGLAMAVSYVGPASSTLVFALGLYMFLSGKWFIRRIVRGLGPPAEGICPACRYDLAGLRVSRCPECGETLPRGIIRAAEVAGKEHRSQKDPPTPS